MRLLVRLVTNIFFTLFIRLELSGKENVPESGPFLLCANHTSELDMFAIGCRIKRWVYYIAKEELFRFPPFGAILKSLGAFPVKRGKGDIGAIKTVYRLLSDGHAVGIFPEGHRVRKSERGKVSIKPGAALIAVNAGVPILPVAVIGDFRLFGKVKISYGKPYFIEADKDRKYSNEELMALSLGIMEKIKALVEAG